MDLADLEVCRRDSRRESWVAPTLLEKLSIEIQGGDQEFATQPLHSRGFQEHLASDPRQEVVDDRDRLVKVRFGDLSLAFGFLASLLGNPPVMLGSEQADRDTSKSHREDDGQRDEKPRDRPVSLGPSPGFLEGADGAGLDRLAFEVAAEVVGEAPGIGVASCRLLGHRLQADRLQVARDKVVELAGRPGFVCAGPGPGASGCCRGRATRRPADGRGRRPRE